MRTTEPPNPTAGYRAAAEEAVASLRPVVGSLRCAGSQRLLRLGISMTHFHVLTLLRHHDAMPMSRLAEVIGTSMPSVTGIVDRMEERGLVERVRVPDDRRIVLVQPTPAGLALVDEAELIGSDLFRRALGHLGDRDLDDLARIMTNLRDAVEAELADAADAHAAHVADAHVADAHVADAHVADAHVADAHTATPGA